MLRFQKLELTLIIELFKFIILVLFCFNDEIDAFTSVIDEFILLNALLNDELSVNIESNVFDALISLYANLRENITKAIEIIPKEYYKNIIGGAYNRKEKYIAKNKTRKNPKKMYL